MTVGVPLAIPRWQWRTFAPDLSWLARRLSVPRRTEGRRSSQTHLVCLGSAHHAWLHDGVLELRWRKEVGGEGFERWDTILHVQAPFAPTHLAKLYRAWGVAMPLGSDRDLDERSFLAGPIAGTPTVRAVPVDRATRSLELEGVTCCLETIRIEPGSELESFAVEHEDPKVLEQLLVSLGLRAGDNTSFLEGLKRGLGLSTNETEGSPWARKSNAST